MRFLLVFLSAERRCKNTNFSRHDKKFLQIAFLFVLLHLHKVEKMKRTWIIILGFIGLISCHNTSQQNGTESQEDLDSWFDTVFTNAALDTTTMVPDYAFSTDWMQRYIQYIDKNYEYRGDMLFLYDTVEVEPFDCRYWALAYVDSDTIPELLLWGGCWVSGSIILTQYSGEVYASPKGHFTYIKGADGLLHSQWKHGDDVWGSVYEMRRGKFTEIASYNLNTDLVDTSEVGDFCLTLDSLKYHYTGGEIGDTVVGISEIELNGQRISVCLGYNQYVNCTGFTQVKQTLDSLYYHNGTSTYFPITSEKPITNLISR